MPEPIIGGKKNFNDFVQWRTPWLKYIAALKSKGFRSLLASQSVTNPTQYFELSQEEVKMMQKLDPMHGVSQDYWHYCMATQKALDSLEIAEGHLLFYDAQSYSSMIERNGGSWWGMKWGGRENGLDFLENHIIPFNMPQDVDAKDVHTTFPFSTLKTQVNLHDIYWRQSTNYNTGDLQYFTWTPPQS